jgi:hypothetical protein
MRFGVLPISRKKRVEKYKCRIPSRGWILGIFLDVGKVKLKKRIVRQSPTKKWNKFLYCHKKVDSKYFKVKI